MTFLASSALGLLVSHNEYICRWQNQHLPQEIVKGTTTRSPFLSLVTPLPTSSTMPIGSCPSTSPACMVGMKPSYRCRSEPQMAVDVMRTRVSPGSTILGSGTVSQRTSLVPCQQIAFMGFSPGSARLKG